VNIPPAIAGHLRRGRQGQTHMCPAGRLLSPFIDRFIARYCASLIALSVWVTTLHSVALCFSTVHGSARGGHDDDED